MSNSTASPVCSSAGSASSTSRCIRNKVMFLTVRARRAGGGGEGSPWRGARTRDLSSTSMGGLLEGADAARAHPSGSPGLDDDSDAPQPPPFRARRQVPRPRRRASAPLRPAACRSDASLAPRTMAARPGACGSRARDGLLWRLPIPARSLMPLLPWSCLLFALAQDATAPPALELLEHARLADELRAISSAHPDLV